jgi:hypothetical protein
MEKIFKIFYLSLPFLFLDWSLMICCDFLKYKQNTYFSTCQ